MMNSKQAIDLLHNNQYQKHLGNGEYDYIHPLTDSEAKAIESLIKRQERMIGMACEWLQKIGCPALADLYCDENCSAEMNGAGCWRRWLEQEAQHD